MDDTRSSSKPPANLSPAQSSTLDTKSPAAARPLYSSKLGDPKGSSNSSSPTSRQPPVSQKAWTSAKNPITGRSTAYTQQNNVNSNSTNRPSVTGSLREGQRVRITLATGAEFEGIYANNPSDSSSCYLKMVQQKKLPGDTANGASKREQPSMSFQRKDITDARVIGGNAAKGDGKTQNGNRSSFRTDTAISNNRLGGERELQRWVPDAPEDLDGSLEKSSNQGVWDQFATNERLFGLKTDYDESIYTTTIDKSHPQYRERMAAAERKAREIERSLPTTAHVAEERVMDFVGGDDNAVDEEDKYSGVKRQQDFPPLASRENKYIPPSRRAPTGQATVKGVPVDPAIISAQLKGAPLSKQPTPKPDEAKTATPAPAKTPTPVPEPKPIPAETATDRSKVEEKVSEDKASENTKSTPADQNAAEKAAALRPAAPAGRSNSPAGKEGAAVPSATSTVEHDVLKSFKSFATQQRLNAEKVRSSKAKADKEVKLIELKKFADSFKLSTPVPSDLISIIAKDPAKQKQIQAKALQNAEEVAKSKAKEAAKENEVTAPKETQAKPAVEQQTPAPASAAAAAATPATDNRSTSRPTAPQHSSSPAGAPNRHPGARQSYGPTGYHGQSYRNDRSPGQNAPRHNQQTGNLAQRLRNVEQQKMSQGPAPHHGNQDMRLPPTGPANNVEPFRRLSNVPPHAAPRLNPNSHEFRPSPFAQTFNPTGPSAASSPRSTVNTVIVEVQQASTPVVGQLIRRRTKAIDVKKCFILSHIKTLPPPHNNRSWEENGGLRPSYDTIPTWKQLLEDEKPDSIMRLTYKEYFDRQPFAGAAMATPNPPHVAPQAPHQHQLPFHMQHGVHTMAPRQSPHMAPMQMQAGQLGHSPHVPFTNGDDHRMMHSTSAQSFASPRMTQVPMAYPAGMNSPAQMPYQQPVMQPFMGPGTPQMNQYRSFSQNPQFMQQQPSHMGTPIMSMPQPYIAGPAPMVAAGPQMQMYPAGQPQFIPPGHALPQPIPGTNGYPSPGRPAAPMMVHQGSQQGQPMYGMSPAMPYQQTVFGPQQPGQMTNMRGFNNTGGPQQFGTSPQQMHNYGSQARSTSYGGKGYQHNQHQGPSANHPAPTAPQGRTPEAVEEAK
ncbi:PAB1-binding protein 1 [Pleurostoma richardsiae]|uniref:PAB1-binding protein 1 n=1 Tax=Pleurostoma richardsiae TaxID=41990 RepID=A0AA38RVP3_9PEZI|nr:PAB1-binding protein 1 [Pleurostoma richardsiae]